MRAVAIGVFAAVVATLATISLGAQGQDFSQVQIKVNKVTSSLDRKSVV
jgi:hypothetical protein